MRGLVESFKLALVRSMAGRTHRTISGLRSDSDNGIYPEYAQRISQDASKFANFKRNPVYRQVLEHVSGPQGAEYIRQIQAKWPELLSDIGRFKINDQVGRPILCSYDGLGLISPTTLRYLKVAADLRELFGDLTDFDVAEIGCGYGGQFFISDMLWRLHSWTLFDLEPVLQLISRYLECHLINSSYRTTTLNRFDGRSARFDLAISNYAFSELPKQLQLKYISKVLSKAQRGYMTMNSGKSGVSEFRLSIVDFREHFPNLEILDEIPLTGASNYILVWGHR
jgi:hypothetical protein